MLLRTVFEQPHAEAVHTQAQRVISTPKTKFPKAARPPGRGQSGRAGVHRAPHEIWSNDPQERPNKEIRCRTGHHDRLNQKNHLVTVRTVLLPRT
jgi:putative transposase